MVDFLCVGTRHFPGMILMILRLPSDSNHPRRECLDHVVVLGETRLRRIVRRHLYYHAARTHLALDKDAPEPRPVQLPDRGTVIEILEVGGLHHRYERRAA